MTISLSSNPAFSRANCSSTGKGVNKTTLNKSIRKQKNLRLKHLVVKDVKNRVCNHVKLCAYPLK